MLRDENLFDFWVRKEYTVKNMSVLVLKVQKDGSSIKEIHDTSLFQCSHNIAEKICKFYRWKDQQGMFAAGMLLYLLRMDISQRGILILMLFTFQTVTTVLEKFIQQLSSCGCYFLF